MYTNTMSNEELERLYYSAGMPEIAVIYAQIVDVEVERDKYHEQAETSVDGTEHANLQKDYDDLKATITAARGQVDELCQRIEIGGRLDKNAVLAALNDLDLETP